MEGLLGLLIIVTLVVLVGGYYMWCKEAFRREHEFAVSMEKSRAQEEEKAKKEKKEAAREKALEHLQRNLRSAFGVELDTIHEGETQDEVVRVMDLLAHRAAAACVNQDKASRGEEAFNSEYKDVQEVKLRWAEARKFILQIAPELASRMPHFSEFEPLKSYREEHLREKAKKRSTA